jgi:PIN domain nuclease of toxin-antitoxin system
MDILLDTCAVVWAAAMPSRLTARARKLLESDDSSIHVSAIAGAEIACAVERGRLALDEHWRRWLHRVLDANGWECLPFGLDVIEEAYSLPGSFHQDPADRILVATARLGRMTIITADAQILEYPHVAAAWS